MKAPDGCFDRDPVFLGCSRFSYKRVVEHAMATIEPAVVAPEKGIWGFMGVANVPAVQEHFRGGVRLVVAVGI